MTHGKSIELFLVNGTANSLITAELSNWNGKAIKIPRIELPSCNRDDITQVGVYFLFCKENDGSDSVYIGEADNVKLRLLQHLRDYQDEKEKYYWSIAIIFIGKDLNKPLIRYLENRFVEIARKSKRYSVLTKNTYNNTIMKESQIAVMDEFVDNVNIIINALGYNVFEPLVKTDYGVSEGDDKILHISSASINATGKITTEGFVLLKGAVVSKKTSSKLLNVKMKKLRMNLLDSDKVNDFVTTENILFPTSSAAAAFIFGYGVIGPRLWKDRNGRTLKEIENASTEQI